MRALRFLPLLCLLVAPAFGQVAFDAATSCTSGTNTATCNHTSSGSNRAAAFGCHWYGNGTAAATMGGVGMTSIVSVSYSGESRLKAALWFDVAPPTSSTAFAVTVTGGNDFLECGVVSFTGVHQTVPLGTPVNTEGTTGPATANCAIATNELGLDYAAGTFSAMVVGSGQTSRVEIENFGGNDSSFGMSTEGGNGTITFDWSLTQVVNRWVAGCFAVKPAGAASSSLLRRRRS